MPGATWTNAAVLRQLAGQVAGLPGVRPGHPEPADRIGAVTGQIDQLRAATSAARARGTTDRR